MSFCLYNCDSLSLPVEIIASQKILLTLNPQLCSSQHTSIVSDPWK